MANGEIYEKNLSNASGIGSGDYLRTVNSNNESEKINYTLLAKAIIEQWTGSSLAGSAQSVKSAIDALNNKFTWTTYMSETNVPVGNTYASTGKTFTLPKASIVRIVMQYGSGRPLAVGVKTSELATSQSQAITAVVNSDITDTSGLTVTALLTAGTYYVWARTSNASGSTSLAVHGFPIGA